MEKSAEFDDEMIERVVSTYIENIRLGAEAKSLGFEAPTLIISSDPSNDYNISFNDQVQIVKSTNAKHLEILEEANAPQICREVDFHMKQAEFT